MRPDLDAGTIALLESGYYDIHHRVQVANGSGTLIDVSNRVHAISWRDPSPDAPIATRTIEFLRDLNDDPATSLAPLIGSDLNVLDDGTTYSALLQVGRVVVHGFAITAVGAARPADISFYEWFRGRLGTPSWGGKDAPVTVHCLDQGGELQRVKIKTATAYAAGTSIEDTIQGVLDDHGYSSIVLNVPVATSVVLDQDFTTGIQKSIWEVIQGLAASIGFVCWWRYQADGAADLVLFEPDRTNVTSAFTFPRTYDVEKLEINEADLGNVILGQFTNEDGVRVDNPEVSDAASIAKYGGFERAFWIVEAEDSVIRTASLMTGAQTAALSDLSEPDAEATYRVPPHPGIECSVDVCTFPADDRHYDEAQDFAPFAVSGEHRARQRPVMRIDVRGKPSGGSGMWRTRRQNQSPVEPESVTQISNVVWTEGTTTGTLDCDVGAKITSRWLGSAIVDSPATAAKWDAVAAGVLPVADADWPVTLTMPTETSGTAQLLLVQIEARYEDAATGELVVGDVHRMVIHPKVSIPVIDDDTGNLVTPTLTGFRAVAGASGAVSDVHITVGSPSGRDLTLRAWVNPSGTDNPNPGGTPDATYALDFGGTPGTTDVGPGNTGWSTGTALLNDIPVWPGRGKVIYFEAEDSEGFTTGVLPFTVHSWMDLVGADGLLIDEAIDRPAAFAASLRPLRRVATLPGSGDYTGDRVAAEDTGLAWEWNGTSWDALTSADGHNFLPFVIANSIGAREAALHSLTAAHLNVADVYVTGLTVTDNSPGAGSIAWSACTVDHEGSTYSVASGNTADEVVWWSPVAGSGTAFQTSTASSLESDGYDQNRGDRIILLNESGTARQVWNGTRIYGGHLTNDAIVSRHVQALVISVGKYIESSNYAAGTAGWRIDGNGDLEANDGTFRGTVSAEAVVASTSFTGTTANFTGITDVTPVTVGASTEDHQVRLFNNAIHVSHLDGGGDPQPITIGLAQWGGVGAGMTDGVLLSDGDIFLEAAGGQISAQDDLRADGGFHHTAGNLGFFGTTGPSSVPSVTGSRSGGTALSSLLNALVSLGLIDDNTTA